MSNIQTRSIAIFAALAALMAATRFNHFGSAASLPDASYAVFFLGWLIPIQICSCVCGGIQCADHRGVLDRLLRDFRSRHQRLVHESRLLVPDPDLRQLVAGWPLVRNAARHGRQGIDSVGIGRMGSQQFCFRIFQRHLLSVLRAFCRNERVRIHIACCTILCFVCFDGTALYCQCSGPAHGSRYRQQTKGAFALTRHSSRETCAIPGGVKGPGRIVYRAGLMALVMTMWRDLTEPS